MSKHLSHVQVLAFFEERDEEGEVVVPASAVATPDGQPVIFTVGASEWKTGWDWEAAFANLLDQIGA